MGEIRTLFFDSYAFFEILSRNENYADYIKDVIIVTTKLNLLELHNGLIHSNGLEFADKKYDEYLQFSVDIDDDIIKKASHFRASFRERKLSYIDCIGYILAKTRGIPFLTGDKQFKDLANVEFVR
jgi:uncharacterized protein